MYLQISLATGLFAALLMFSGDMILYFTTGRYDMDGTLNPYIGIMKDFPEWRLRFGGLLGPVAAFFYCIGFSQIVFAVAKEYIVLGIATALISSLGIIVGGAYHAQFTYLGLVGKYGGEKIVPSMMKNIMLLSKISMYSLAIGAIVLSGLILFGKTIYPAWMVCFTPTATIFLSFIWMKAPQPFRVVLFGGWYNLIYVIFFLTALIAI